MTTIARMDIRDTRRQRLAMLVEQLGGQAALARQVGLDRPAYLSQLLTSRRNMGHEFARRIELACDLVPGWLDRPIMEGEAEGQAYGHVQLPLSHRYVPVLTMQQAGHPQSAMTKEPPSEGAASVGIDTELADTCGPNTFAIIIDTEAMLPDYHPGDVVVVDPDATPRPGDDVIAKFEHEQSARLKKYRDRGHDGSGERVIELVPRNDDYPILVMDKNHPGQIIGPVVEHRRRFRRRRSNP